MRNEVGKVDKKQIFLNTLLQKKNMKKKQPCYTNMFIYMYLIDKQELLQERKAWRREKYEVGKKRS